MNEIEKTEVLDIEVPGNALTSCPLARFNQVGVRAICAKCELFLGLVDVGAPDTAPFAVRYRVHCNAPRILEIVEVNLGQT